MATRSTISATATTATATTAATATPTAATAPQPSALAGLIDAAQAGDLTAEQARALAAHVALGPEAIVAALLGRRRSHRSTPTRGGRRPGAKVGHPGARRPAPPTIDRRVEHRLTHCPDCGGELQRRARTRTMRGVDPTRAIAGALRELLQAGGGAGGAGHKFGGQNRQLPHKTVRGERRRAIFCGNSGDSYDRSVEMPHFIGIYGVAHPAQPPGE